MVFSSFASNLVAGDTNGAEDVFVKDLKTGAVARVSTDALGREGNYSSSGGYGPAVIPNGRYVAFSSFASNLVADDTDGRWDVFVKDLKTGAVTRVSTNALGEDDSKWSLNPAISRNGRYVVFASGASNLVVGDTNDAFDIFRYDFKGSP